MSGPRQLPRERGQAMVEMAIIAGFIVLIFVGILYLGKFHDIQASTIQAARYSAWERTVRPASYSDATLQEQTRARLFTWNTQPFKTADAKANGASWGNQSDMWEEHGGNGRLVKRPDDVLVRTAYGALPGKGAAFVSSAISQVSGAIGSITGGEKLPTGGLYTSNVSVKLNNVASLPAPLNALNLTLNETSALVIDNWDSNGPDQVARRTASFTPAAALRKADAVLGPIRSVLSVIEPDFANFRPGQICPDVVPADRVSNSAGNLPAYGGAQCF